MSDRSAIDLLCFLRQVAGQLGELVALRLQGFADTMALIRGALSGLRDIVHLLMH